MGTNRTLLVALAIAWVAALAGLVWMMTAAGASLRHVPFLLIDSGPVLRAGLLLSVVSTVIGVGGAVGSGVLGALYGAAGARSMLINMNPPIPFSVYAPNYAEAIIVLLVGLTGAVVCLGLLDLRSPR